MNKQRRAEIATIIAGVAAVKDRLSEVLEAEVEYFENMPESLKESERGEKTEEIISRLEDALQSIEEAELALEESVE